jgi:hypothetical protein
MEEMVKASWSLLEHDGAAAFGLSERSPLPRPLPANDLPGRRTQILHPHQIRSINHHPVESIEDSAPESFSDNVVWLNWNGDLENPIMSEENCPVDSESDIEHDNTIDDPAFPEQQVVSAWPNVPGLVQPTRKSKRQAENLLVMVNAAETWRNTEVTKKYH